MLLQMSRFHSFYGATSLYAFLANGTATAHDTAPRLSFHLCPHAENHQVLFLFSHGMCIFEAESGTSSSPRPPLSGKLDLLVPSPTPQDPSPSLFTHLSLPCPLCPHSQRTRRQTEFHIRLILCAFLMYAVGIIVNVGTVGQYSAARPSKISEVSSHAFQSLAAHGSHSNDTGLHTLWDLLWSVLMQLFLHPGTLATELWASDLSQVPCGGRFLRSFLGQLCLKVIIPSRTCPGHLEKTREG